MYVFFFQAEDGIRDLVRSRGLGDVYKRQIQDAFLDDKDQVVHVEQAEQGHGRLVACAARYCRCLLYTSDAADERSSVDLGGRRIIKKKNRVDIGVQSGLINNTDIDI